jgi:NarL family two-component system response regulator LiaR
MAEESSRKSREMTSHRTPKQRIRVMTVDDHEIMRGGIRFLLLAFDDLELIAEARSGEEAVRLCAETCPDVVLMDMKMPEMDGIAATKAIKEASPNTQVLFLTGFHERSLVRQAMRAGAIGYLLKDTSKEDLAAAIRAAAAGRGTMSPEAANALAQDDEPLTASGGELTEREREVLRLLTQGLSNKKIAARIEISEFTVRNHVSQIIAKLGVANRSEAAVLAVQRGLVG